MPAQALLILASRSPRRRQMLADTGFAFETAAGDIDETPLSGEAGADFARRIAGDKARVVAARHPDAVVLAADTDVELDGRMLGKPRDCADALAMLAALSGRSHRVHSAVAAASGGGVPELVQTVTTVHFAEVAPRDAAAYWDSGEPADKAGGYAIQGYAARWVRAVEGSVSAVIGLPLVETIELLARFDVHPEVPAK